MRALFQLITATLLLGAVLPARGVILNWASLPGGQTWANGSLNNSYNLDGVAGNDINISVVSTGVTFANSGGPYPQNVSDPVIASGTRGLQLWTTAGMTNTTNNVTVTITFLGTYAAGVYASLYLYDVDLGAGSFIDLISNISGDSGTVPLIVTGTANNTVADSGTLGATVTGTGATTSHSGDVSLSSGATKVSSITFRWSNPGPNFGGQAIDLGNIVFFTTPEIGTGIGALLLCGGLAASARWRRPRAAA